MPDRPAEPGPARPAARRGLPPGAAAAADDLVRSYQRGEGQPGIAYGIVAGGSLAHEGGVGQRWLGGPPPDAGTVFRIASMTKSFTASAVLALRDAGLLRLDDPVTDFVPELRGQPGVTADSPAISLRHLLTMTAGFPTDDPWGDRQQGTPLPEFAALLARGVRPAWAPGTRFEYSNLGYALLGRVISAVAEADYPDFVRARVLGPLGMTRTGFEAGEFDPAGLARGYARSPDGWTELAPDPLGAFAPMGGVFSCVRDLARWVNGFAAAFPAGRPAGRRMPHPLSPATRREMQQPAVTLPRAQPRFPGDPAAGSQYGYGFGLFTEETSAWGRLVYHSGGYPGFGSHMRWHPETGLGVIVLANSTYAGASVLAARLMEEVLGASGRRGGGRSRGAADGERPGARARGPLAGDPAGPAGGHPAADPLGGRRGGAALRGQRRAGRAAAPAPREDRPDVGRLGDRTQEHRPPGQKTPGYRAAWRGDRLSSTHPRTAAGGSAASTARRRWRSCSRPRTRPGSSRWRSPCRPRPTPRSGGRRRRSSTCSTRR